MGNNKYHRGLRSQGYPYLLVIGTKNMIIFVRYSRYFVTTVVINVIIVTKLDYVIKNYKTLRNIDDNSPDILLSPFKKIKSSD